LLIRFNGPRGSGRRWRPGPRTFDRGDELGQPEVEDLPDDVLQDPEWTRSGDTRRGRDGCRGPIPWQPGGPPYGFSPTGGGPLPASRPLGPGEPLPPDATVWLDAEEPA
jgi:alpha-glucosidase